MICISSTAPLAPVIDTQKTLAYDQLFLCWRLPQDSALAWHFSVEYQRRAGVVGATWGGTRSHASTAWQRLDEVRGTSAVVDRLQMDSVYVLRVRGCNKAGFGEYSEEVYLHTPPAPGKIFMHITYKIIYLIYLIFTSFTAKKLHLSVFLKNKNVYSLFIYSSQNVCKYFKVDVVPVLSFFNRLTNGLFFSPSLDFLHSHIFSF